MECWGVGKMDQGGLEFNHDTAPNKLGGLRRAPRLLYSRTFKGHSGPRALYSPTTGAVLWGVLTPAGSKMGRRWQQLQGPWGGGMTSDTAQNPGNGL